MSSSLVLKGTQRIHNLLKSRLIQSIIHPLLIISSIVITIIITYKQACAEIGNTLSYDNLIGSNNSSSHGLTLLSSDLEISDNQLNFTDAVTTYSQLEYQLLSNLLENHQNESINQLTGLQTTTTNSINDYLTQTQQLQTNLTSEFQVNLTEISNDYTSLLQALNSSIITQLEDQQQVISNYKTELSNGVYVGESVNIDGLELNITEIQDLLETALNRDIIDSYGVEEAKFINVDKVKDEISDVFEYAINQLKDMNYADELSLNQSTYIIEMTPILSSTKYSNLSSNSSATTTTSLSMKKFINEINIAMIVIGISLIVSYFFILLYQYFKFKYECNLRIRQFIELSEKNNNNNDYIEIMQKFDDVQVSMMTDLEMNLVKDNDRKDSIRVKLFWLNDYLFGSNSNLPTLGMVIILMLILLLSVSKYQWGSTNDVETTSGSNIGVIKRYSIEKFDDIVNSDAITSTFNELMSAQLSQTSNITSNLTSSLESIYSQYFINLTTPQITSTSFQLSNNINALNMTSSIEPIIASLQDITLTQSITINSTNFTSKNLAQKANQIILSTLKATFRLLTVILVSAFAAIVLVGCVYSFFI